MPTAVDTASAPGHGGLIAPAILIPGARERGMLTSFGSSAADALLLDGPSTMDAATIAERQREGGGAPSQRRSEEDRSWRGLVRRLRQRLVMAARSGGRLRTNPADGVHLTVASYPTGDLASSAPISSGRT